MVTVTRRCKHCGKAGAHSFNDMCNPCWETNINKNIKEIVDKMKKEQF